MHNTNNNGHKNSGSEGTQGTSPDTKKVLKLVFESLEEINFRLRLHPSREQILQRLQKGEEPTVSINDADQESGIDEENQNDGSSQQLNLDDLLSGISVKERDYNLIATLEIIEKAKDIGYPVGAKHGDIFVYNGKFWDTFDPEDFKSFLERCYLRLGVPFRYAKHAKFRKDGLKQFEASALIEEKESIATSLNFQNCTLKFLEDGSRQIAEHDPKDFITYVLPYEYNQETNCPKFQKYLDDVIPERDKQKVLAEFIGSVFSDLKHEKVLILFGSGHNGKSVFFDIVTALLGSENVSSHTLQSITDSKLYFIGDLAKSLLNYSGEISTKVSPDMLKKLASGEKVTARYPHGRPFEVENYARFAFNCNTLPDAEENTEGFFRRFLIIPFEKHISKAKRDPRLAEKIIDSELPGIMNWVIEGLNRLERNEEFTYCESSERVLKEYKKESDTVGLFVEKNQDIFAGPMKSSDLYELYDNYCRDFSLSKLGSKNFAQQLENKGIRKCRKSDGVYYDVHEYRAD